MARTPIDAQLQAQHSVLRILAPELCTMLDDMFQEIEGGVEHQGRYFCPCGEINWDEDDPTERVRDHECAFGRALNAWNIFS